MSASEKLKALGVYTDRGGNSGPYDVDERDRADSLLAALPQIVAVVEAAEKAPKSADLHKPLIRALAALDEVLS